MNIIGINGFKRSGKGTVANFIEAQVEGTVLQIGFADKLKVLAARSLGYLTLSDAENIALMDEAKESWVLEISSTKIHGVNGISGREYLQWMGTEARKIFDSDFWVDQVLPKPGLDGGTLPRPAGLGAARHPVTNYELSQRYPGVGWLLITDLRFENEAQRVLNLGGEVWRVNHPAAASDGHASEQLLPRHLVTREVDNSGTLDDLKAEVKSHLEWLR